MQGGLRNLSQHWNKTIIFTEIGYCSGNCTMGPQIDMPAQTLWYNSMFFVWKDITWFGGAFWWNWLTDPAFGGEFK
jgi:hypothetical protein